jgi:hypothetical protein
LDWRASRECGPLDRFLPLLAGIGRFLSGESSSIGEIKATERSP